MTALIEIKEGVEVGIVDVGVFVHVVGDGGRTVGGVDSEVVDFTSPSVGIPIIRFCPKLQNLIGGSKVAFVRRYAVLLDTVEEKFHSASTACSSQGDVLPNIVFCWNARVIPNVTVPCSTTSQRHGPLVRLASDRVGVLPSNHVTPIGGLIAIGRLHPCGNSERGGDLAQVIPR